MVVLCAHGLLQVLFYRRILRACRCLECGDTSVIIGHQIAAIAFEQGLRHIAVDDAAFQQLIAHQIQQWLNMLAALDCTLKGTIFSLIAQLSANNCFAR
ncbi:hypothetical protein PspS35_18855 [Pseudomonas sp. S35]|nr:hypothetical protein PspS35_18855 [Pseudomonas sp. S35]